MVEAAPRSAGRVLDDLVPEYLWDEISASPTSKVCTTAIGQFGTCFVLGSRQQRRQRSQR